ncbi:MAG: HAMP domain-containing protein [Parachlamydiales bacterium]|jgi:HAMP domain-containing protein
MTIRKRLLSLLLPPLIAFVTIISLFFHYNWKNEILGSFKEKALSTVIGIASVLPTEKVDELIQGEGNSLQLEKQFTDIVENLGLNSLYLVQVVPVKKGEKVLLNQPLSPHNPIYDGKNTDNAFRLVFLQDVSITSPRANKEQDYSESGEQLLYLNARPMVTDEYKERGTNEHIITAYAPLTNAKGQVIALLGADIANKTINEKLKSAAIVIALSALATIVLVILSVYYAANRISEPVQKIKLAALNLAAGEYGTTVDVKGPLEIEELGNTLNTMSECLMENIHRLKHSSAMRERLFGEYECALLLQEKMFMRSIAEFEHPLFIVKGLHTQSAQEPHGIHVSFSTKEDGSLILEMMENPEKGFDGVYRLLESVAEEHCRFPCTHIELSADILHYERHGLPPLIIWQNNQIHFLEDKKGSLELKKDAIILVTSRILWDIVGNTEGIEKLLQRVFTNFSKDSFDIFASMLQQELNFLSDKHHFEKDIFVTLLTRKR